MDAGLPCLVGKCAADTARKRLASSEDLHPLERADLELDALGCQGPQADPFDRSLMWDGCPAKAALRRHDIEDAVTLRGLAAMAPLAGWPAGYTARTVETWITIEAEKAALREERAARG